MKIDNLQDYFSGIKIDGNENKITYLVNQYFDEILNFLKNDVLYFKHLPGGNDNTILLLSTEKETYKIDFKGNQDAVVISNMNPKPLDLYLGLISESKIEYITRQSREIKFGIKPKK